MDFKDYIVIGSYFLGAGSWAFLYRMIKELKHEINMLRIELAFEKGKNEGANVLARLLRLEQQHAQEER